MTKFSQLYEKEKIEYGNQRTKETIAELALRMLRRGMDIVDIMEVTGLTEGELLSLQDKNVMV